MEKVAEFGLQGPEMAGLLLLASVIVFFMSLAAFIAARYKGQSAIAWGIIAAAAQSVAVLLPLSLIALTGLADPRDVFLSGDVPTFETFRLFTEMSAVAGFATLAVLGFIHQTKWKLCPACDASIPWRAKTCPQCASSQLVTPATDPKLEPGAYPRLRPRMIHLPVELDDRLKRIARPLRKRLSPTTSMTEDAAVSQFVRNILEQIGDDLEPVVEETAEVDGESSKA